MCCWNIHLIERRAVVVITACHQSCLLSPSVVTAVSSVVSVSVSALVSLYSGTLWKLSSQHTQWCQASLLSSLYQFCHSDIIMAGCGCCTVFFQDYVEKLYIIKCKKILEDSQWRIIDFESCSCIVTELCNCSRPSAQ